MDRVVDAVLDNAIELEGRELMLQPAWCKQIGRMAREIRAIRASEEVNAAARKVADAAGVGWQPGGWTGVSLGWCTLHKAVAAYRVAAAVAAGWQSNQARAEAEGTAIPSGPSGTSGRPAAVDSAPATSPAALTAEQRADFFFVSRSTSRMQLVEHIRAAEQRVRAECEVEVKAADQHGGILRAQRDAAEAEVVRLKRLQASTFSDMEHATGQCFALDAEAARLRGEVKWLGGELQAANQNILNLQASSAPDALREAAAEACMAAIRKGWPIAVEHGDEGVNPKPLRDAINALHTLDAGRQGEAVSAEARMTYAQAPVDERHGLAREFMDFRDGGGSVLDLMDSLDAYLDARGGKGAG